MEQPFRALVVDDEPAVRQLTIRALTTSGLVCEEAADGDEAAELLREHTIDVLVADLKMPKRNGHSLAVEVLNRGPGRPLVVVLTGILESRLATDLIDRGVDDITFKPVDFNVFAAKVRALCVRRRRQGSAPPAEVKRASSAESSVAESKISAIGSITIEELERRLEALAGLLPVSPAAAVLADRIQKGSPSLEEVARLVARDPLLAVEVLRLANPNPSSPGQKRIDSLQQAIAAVGDRRISEIAMASPTLLNGPETNALGINVDVMLRRSLASGQIMAALNSPARIGAEDEGLFLAALLLPMSRVFMGLAVPELYKRMIAHCKETGCSLTSVEEQVLPLTPARALSGILARWNISPRLFKPLQHAGQSYLELATISEPLRSKVERLRVAELLAQIAVGIFDPWDEISFPHSETMCRLRTDDLRSILAETRAECRGVLNAGPSSASQPLNDRRISYYKLGVESHDFLADLLDGLGIDTCRISRDAACSTQPALVNCLDASPERLEWFLDDAVSSTGRPLVCNTPLPAHFESWGPVVQIPCSFAHLRNVFNILLLRPSAPTTEK